MAIMYTILLQNIKRTCFEVLAGRLSQYNAKKNHRPPAEQKIGDLKYPKVMYDLNFQLKQKSDKITISLCTRVKRKTA